MRDARPILGAAAQAGVPAREALARCQRRAVYRRGYRWWLCQAGLGLLCWCFLGASALAAEKGGIEYVSGDGMVACPTADFAEARAAIRVGDQKWLAATGCFVLDAGTPLVIVSGHDLDWNLLLPPFPPTEKTWRVHVYLSGERGVTAFVEARYASVSPKLLALPADIHLTRDGMDKSRVFYFVLKFEDANRFLAGYVTFKEQKVPDTREDLWTVVATGLTARQAIAWCGRAKLSPPGEICEVELE